MKMNKEISNDLWYCGYKIEIFPNEDQKEFFEKCFNIKRFMYNRTIEFEETRYKNGEKFLDFFSLVPKFTELRKKLTFLQEVPVGTGRCGVLRACKAYDSFFCKNNRKPKFQSKKLSKYHDSYDTRAERMYFEDNMLKVEGLKTLIYTNYHTGFTKKFRQFKNTVISRDNMGRYFISFQILQPKPLTYFEDNNIKPLNRAIGIDINNKNRFVLSTGKIFKGPDLTKELNKLKYKQAKVSKDIDRRKKMERTNPSKDCQSKRADKRLRAMQKQYKRVANITENFIQTTTKEIIKMRPNAIVMENLDVQDMLKNHNIAKNTYHANFGRCKVVMENKCNKYNIPFILAEKDYPSTQICSSCGNRKEMKLFQKKYKCPKCGMIMDRDINAALNLEHLAYPTYA